MDRPLIWVERGSLEYQLFVQRLEENLQEKIKRSVCVACWAFIAQPEKQSHPEHRDYILASHCITNE